MCSYDVDSFREFIQSPGFQDVFDLDPLALDTLLKDEDALLQFGYRFLKQVLFGERTIPLREGAREKRLEKARERLAQRQAEMTAQAEKQVDERYEGE